MVQGRKLIALLALNDHAEGLCPNRHRYAETPALLRQVDMAAALGCDTILLLANDAADSDALAAQHLTEASGLNWRLLTRAANLPDAVPDDAELVVFTPGALASDLATLQALAGHLAIFTLPADHDAAPMMERLDLHYAWAGVLRMPGHLISELASLGDDCEPMSALPRLARSASVEERALPSKLIETGKWCLSATATAASDGPRSEQPDEPGVLHIAAHGYASRNWPGVLPFVFAAVALALSIAALFFDRPAIGIMFSVLAMIGAGLGAEIRKRANPLQLSQIARNTWISLVKSVPEMVAAAALALGIVTSDSLMAATFAAVSTFALIRLGRETASARTSALYAAPVIWAVVALLGTLGLWWLGAAFASAASLLGIAMHLRRSHRITGS